jgi:hypothetical protein
VQAAEIRHAVAERDVGAPAGHVGRHRYGAELSGAGHDLRFGAVVARVEDGVLEAKRVQALRQRFGIGDRVGAHQNGTARTVELDDPLCD